MYNVFVKFVLCNIFCSIYEFFIKFSKTNSNRLEKLLLSAISNWQQANEEIRLEEADLFIKAIKVDGGRILKRLRPAPQGRGYRIRKRSNHVTLVVDSTHQPEVETKEEVKDTKK